jgi:hypothetical protein
MQKNNQGLNWKSKKNKKKRIKKSNWKKEDWNWMKKSNEIKCWGTRLKKNQEKDKNIEIKIVWTKNGLRKKMH